jgi:hypothetical protein
MFCYLLVTDLAERAEKAAAEAKKQEEADAKAKKEADKAARLVSYFHPKTHNRKTPLLFTQSFLRLTDNTCAIHTLTDGKI